MSPRDRTVSFGILYDKERLENGHSTVNLLAQFTQVDISLAAPKRDKIDCTLPPGEDEEAR